MASRRSQRRRALEDSELLDFLYGQDENDDMDCDSPENVAVYLEEALSRPLLSVETDRTIPIEFDQQELPSTVEEMFDSTDLISSSDGSSISELSDYDGETDGDDPPVPPEPMDMDMDLDQPLSLKLKLAIWKVKGHANQCECDDLLSILREDHPELPKSTRALVHTPRSVAVTEMEPGLYHHRGLEEGIRHTLMPYSSHEIGNELKIYLAVDGVSLTKSSTSQFWPIVGYIPSLQRSSPFEVGIYWGMTKPASSNLYLRRTIDEAVLLSKEGMLWKNRRITVFVKAFVADAPARASLTCTKSHASHLHGCSKCDGAGFNIGALRTNYSFREKLDPLHHHGPSEIEKLDYFNCIDGVPLDAMHCCDLGIEKRKLDFLTGKTKTIPNVTLNPASIRAMNSSLLALRRYISRADFARVPRSLNDLPRFKATEFRQILHYTGLVLYQQLGTKAYEHFLHLHYAIRLLSMEPWCSDPDEVAFAHKLLCEYVKNSPEFLSEGFMCYNLHCLLHLAREVLIHGPLYSFSAYRFENFYGYLKKFLKFTQKPLQQLVRRLQERNNFIPWIARAERRSFNSPIKFSRPQKNGPIVPGCTGTQFKKAEKHGSWLLRTTDDLDNCVFLNDLTVVRISNFVQQHNRNIIIGRKYLCRVDLYKVPAPSSGIFEFKVSQLSPELRAWDMKDIKCKAVNFPAHFPIDNEHFAVCPHLMQ